MPMDDCSPSVRIAAISSSVLPFLTIMNCTMVSKCFLGGNVGNGDDDDDNDDDDDDDNSGDGNFAGVDNFAGVAGDGNDDNVAVCVGAAYDIMSSSIICGIGWGATVSGACRNCLG